ncbi:hypothetical protein P700755_002684 [Psychroflexus torquis ATCC 700755]|uniref:Uncharacterized protein n=2 Tax=Psychroflexus TaxID=83612 RepID=K4IVC6_PSYTT|nr:hypothetical protein P700755_002684 [Psychroflexus torquis ATCC 700755]
MYSQSEKEIIEYKADGIYVVLQNDKGEQLTKIPFGKGVFIYYDTFFKSIEILYENREGQIDAMKLLFLGEKENDGVKYLQMKDAFGGKFSVFGNIAKSGVLIIIMEKKTEDGNIMLLTITGAKKQ